MAKRTIEDYKDIINYQYKGSEKGKRMAMVDRAAQFSPFAALSGYDGAVREAERLTDTRIELGEDEQQRLSDQLNFLKTCLNDRPEVKITYFVPDDKKTGGAYRTIIGTVKKIDEIGRNLIMTDETEVPIGEIIELDGAIFRSLDE